MLSVSYYAIPTLLFFVSLILLISKRVSFNDFIEGAKGGLESGVKLIPTLVILMSGIKMLTASGAIDILMRAASPLFRVLNIPSEMLPYIITKPISGSASTVMLNELFALYGTDSFISRAASLLAGSTDTILYTVSVYFSYVGIKRTRHSLPCSFLAFIFAIFMSAAFAKILF